MDGGVPKSTVTDLLASPEGCEVIVRAMKFSLKKLQYGKGKFGVDGSFNSNTLTFGEPFKPTSNAHRIIRYSLLETVAYMQGTAFAFQYLEENEGVLPQLRDDEHFAKLFDEAHWNRSKMLLNLHYKKQASCGVGHMTLSQITAVSMKNETRNRMAIREKIAPVFLRFGIWIKTNGNNEKKVNFMAGKFLILFHETVLTPFLIEKRGGEEA